MHNKIKGIYKGFSFFSSFFFLIISSLATRERVGTVWGVVSLLVVGVAGL